MICEIKKWRRCCKFFTLKDHGYEGRRHNQSRSYLCRAHPDCGMQPVSEGTVADLIMILNVAKKAMSAKTLCWVSMILSSILRVRAIIDKDRRQRLCELCERPKVAVIALT